MPDLHDAADQFARDILANNIAGLLPAFTSAGVGKAMTMQAEMGAFVGEPRYELADQGGGRVEISFTDDEGSGSIFTQWVEVDGAWKVDDMGRLT